MLASGRVYQNIPCIAKISLSLSPKEIWYIYIITIYIYISLISIYTHIHIHKITKPHNSILWNICPTDQQPNALQVTPIQTSLGFFQPLTPVGKISLHLYPICAPWDWNIYPHLPYIYKPIFITYTIHGLYYGYCFFVSSSTKVSSKQNDLNTAWLIKIKKKN